MSSPFLLDSRTSSTPSAATSQDPLPLAMGTADAVASSSDSTATTHSISPATSAVSDPQSVDSLVGVTVTQDSSMQLQHHNHRHHHHQQQQQEEALANLHHLLLATNNGNPNPCCGTQPAPPLLPQPPSSGESLEPSQEGRDFLQQAMDLQAIEARIDLQVLHQGGGIVTSGSHGNQSAVVTDRAVERRIHFRETVMSVYEIVENKLYKTRKCNLETYFRNVWKISRAQVYRFYNCARVLLDLEGFEVLPSRERLCRSIKRYTKIRQVRRLLWQTTLEMTGFEDAMITSTTITAAWKHLRERGLVVGNGDSGSTEIGAMEEPESLGSIEEEEFAASSVATDSRSSSRSSSQLSMAAPVAPPTAKRANPSTSGSTTTRRNVRRKSVASTPSARHVPTPPPSAESNSYAAMAYKQQQQLQQSHFQQMRRHSMMPAVPSSFDSHLMSAQDSQQMQSVFQTIKDLSARGLFLQPLINGQWVSSGITDWRFQRANAAPIMAPPPHLPPMMIPHPMFFQQPMGFNTMIPPVSQLPPQQHQQQQHSNNVHCPPPPSSSSMMLTTPNMSPEAQKKHDEQVQQAAAEAEMEGYLQVQ